MSKKKDRTPAEIAVIRRRREKKRLARAWVIWVAWLLIFTAGVILNSEALMSLAFALNMATLAVTYGLYEKALRKIAARPPVDYGRIRKLEKRELPKGIGTYGQDVES